MTRSLNPEALKRRFNRANNIQLAEEALKKAIEGEELVPFGWRCPVCNRGLSPWASVCPCDDSAFTRKINHMERVIRRKVEQIDRLEREILDAQQT